MQVRSFYQTLIFDYVYIVSSSILNQWNLNVLVLSRLLATLKKDFFLAD